MRHWNEINEILANLTEGEDHAGAGHALGDLMVRVEFLIDLAPADVRQSLDSVAEGFAAAAADARDLHRAALRSGGALRTRLGTSADDATRDALAQLRWVISEMKDAGI